MPESFFQFEEFELDLDSCELRRAGCVLKLERIPMELLALLLQNAGKLVRRQVIEMRLWGEGSVLETTHSINTAVNKLRFTLRDDSRNPRFIQTVVGQGYKFIGDVRVTRPCVDDSGVSEQPAPFHSDPLTTVFPVTLLSASSIDPGHDVNNGTPAREFLPAAELPPSEVQGTSLSRVFARRLAIVSLVCIALIILAIGANHILRAPKLSPRNPLATISVSDGVAVLPFHDLAEDSDRSYLAYGMTDQLISDLAMSTPLRVISHQSVMQYKNAQLSLPQIAKELHVGAIVEGSYLQQGNEIRIIAQLLDAQNDQHLWAQSYRESDQNPIAMQDEVAADIARQVALVVGTSYSGQKSQKVSEEARNAYLHGEYLRSERTASSLLKAITYYKEAIRVDPRYADAYGALSQSYLLYSVYCGQNPAEALREAQSAAERALTLNSNLSSAHVALAGVKTDKDWDWSGAEREYRRAIAINPSDATAHHWYGLHLIRLERGQEGLGELKTALSLDPLSLIIATDIAESYYLLRNNTQALRQIDQVLSLNPTFAQARIVKGKILNQLGRYSEAEMEFASAGRLFGGGEYTTVQQGITFARQGKLNRAAEVERSLEDTAKTSYITGVHIAELACALRKDDDAMRWLNRAYQQHDMGINMIGVDPGYDNCRSDSRFQELLQRLKLQAQ